MILSGREIRSRLGKDISIEPYNESQLNPNSYNLRLHRELLTYDAPILDMKERHRLQAVTIPEDGYVLQPNKLYLSRTVEYTKTENLVPMLEGRSSVGRLGLFIHVTAGFGDVGFRGYWTLELSCIQPVRIYPNIEICQIFYHTIQGSFDPYCSDKYQNNSGTQPSMMYKELKQL